LLFFVLSNLHILNVTMVLFRSTYIVILNVVLRIN